MFVVLELENGRVCGPAHKPNQWNGEPRGGTTFSRYTSLELPLRWSTVCGRKGVVYLDVALIRDAFESCRKCNR